MWSPLLLLSLLPFATATSDFSCPLKSNPYDCICSADNAQFTSQLCTYINQANSSSSSYSASSGANTLHFPDVMQRLVNSSAPTTVFAINNSAFTALDKASTSAYKSDLQSGIAYLVVPQLLSDSDLATLSHVATMDLGQLILFTHSTTSSSSSAKNLTVLNDDDTCVLSSCTSSSPRVCLVSCVLAPTDSLGTIAIIGIAVAGVAAVCLVVACMFNIFRKDSDQEEEGEGGEYQAANDGE